MLSDHLTRVVPVSDSSQVSEARRAVRDLASQNDFSDEDGERASIVVTEAATNLIKHTPHGGNIIATSLKSSSGCSIQILSVDNGPGLDVSKCMTDGFTTTSSPGTGMGAMRRQSDEFDIYAQPSGTVVLCIVHSRKHQRPKNHYFHIGAISAAVSGEDVCGDGWELWQSHERFVLMLADGLGHGLLAHEAAEEARRVFGLTHPPQPRELLDNIHRAMQKTRGGAVSIADIRLTSGKLTFCGLGNVAGVIAGDQHRNMVSMNGTVGVGGTARTREFDYPWYQDAILIMHSDGLNSHWSLDAYPGIRLRHPAIIAGLLFRDSVRGRDDATVVVVKRMND